LKESDKLSANNHSYQKNHGGVSWHLRETTLNF